MKSLDSNVQYKCSICHSVSVRLTSHLGGYVCESCSEQTRIGADATSQALRQQQCANAALVKQLTGEGTWLTPDEFEYQVTSNAFMAQETLNKRDYDCKLGSGGEVIDSKDAGLINTLNEPRIAAIEASNHRTDLLTALGNDIAAMALDASDSIAVSNSLEKMFVHQMAATHEAGMKMFCRANLMEDYVAATKCMTAAIKACTAYQGAMVKLEKMRSNKRQ